MSSSNVIYRSYKDDDNKRRWYYYKCFCELTRYYLNASVMIQSSQDHAQEHKAQVKFNEDL